MKTSEKGKCKNSYFQYLMIYGKQKVLWNEKQMHLFTPGGWKDVGGEMVSEMSHEDEQELVK